MKVYLAGTMSSRKRDRGTADFDHYHSELVKRGHQVVDPRTSGGYGGLWHVAMRRDIAALTTCDALAVIPGVADTDRGVWEEIKIALVLGIPIAGADSPFFDSSLLENRDTSS